MARYRSYRTRVSRYICYDCVRRIRVEFDTVPRSPVTSCSSSRNNYAAAHESGNQSECADGSPGTACYKS
eukprot:1629163-Amphidinium_carterae.1